MSVSVPRPIASWRTDPLHMRSKALRAHLKFILPIAGIFALLVLYSVYWFFAASKVNEAVLEWIEEKESVGYQIA